MRRITHLKNWMGRKSVTPASDRISANAAPRRNRSFQALHRSVPRRIPESRTKTGQQKQQDQK